MDNSGTLDQNQVPNQNQAAPNEPMSAAVLQTVTTPAVSEQTPPPVSEQPVSPWQSTPVQPLTTPTTMPTPDSAPSWQGNMGTEMSAPVAPVPTPAAQPVMAPPVIGQVTPPVSEQPVSPWQSTPVQPLTTPTTMPTPDSAPAWQGVPTADTQTPAAPATTETEGPLVPKKAKIPPVVIGVLSLFVVAGIAGGTYLLSMGVSSQQAVAPNAPSSQPKAFDPNEGTNIPFSNPTSDVPFDQTGTVDCTDIPFTAAYGNRCVPIVTLESGEVTWAPGAIEALTQ